MDLYLEELESFEALYDWDQFFKGFTDGTKAIANVCTFGLT